ncbi:hypothetical protein BH20ACT5_BH20ACT5_16220 [soil metagenome]
MLLAVTAIALLGWAVAQQWTAVRASTARIGLLPLLHCLFWACAGLLLSALAWRAGLAALGSRLPMVAALRVFFLSQAGKYLPGSVWPFLAQMELGREHGVPPNRSGTAGVLFLVLHLATGLVVALLALPFSGELLESGYAWFLLALVPLLIALHPRVLGAVLNRLFRLLRRPPLPPLGWAAVLVPSTWLAGMWLAYGISIAALIAPLERLTPTTWALAIGGYALAWSAGFLVLVVPAGVGVREAVLVLALLPLMATGPATSVAALARLAHTGGDLLWALAVSPRRRATRPAAVSTAPGRGTGR